MTTAMYQSVPWAGKPPKLQELQTHIDNCDVCQLQHATPQPEAREEAI